MIYSLAIIASLLLGTQAALAAPAAGKAGTYTNVSVVAGPAACVSRTAFATERARSVHW